MKRKTNSLRAGVKRFSVNAPEQPTTSSKPTAFRNATVISRKTQIKNLDQEPLQEEYTFGKALTKTYAEFCSDSTIHGFHYLHQNRKRRENIFWLILLLMSVLQFIYLIRKQYHRWQTTPVILTFSEREIPISSIPFPAITICAETKFVKTETINFTRFYHYLRSYANQERVVKPPPWLTDDEYLKMRALLQVCGNYLVEGIEFPEYPPMNVTHYLNDIAPSFESNFLFCQFNRTSGGCKPFFEKIYTKEGICYSFNALNETELYRQDTHQYRYFEDDKHVRKRHKDVDWTITDGYADIDDYDTYPERVIGSGIHSGLLVVLQGHLQDAEYICRGPVQGFKVVLHSPDDVPQVKKNFFLVPYEEDIVMLMQPSYTTDDVKRYRPERRKCYYPEERYLRFFQFYTQNNCEIECLSNFTLRKCGCVHFSMPRLVSTRVCDAANIRCYDEAEDAFLLSEFTGHGLKEEKCNCLPGCWSLDYSVEMSSGALSIDRVVEAHGNNEFIEQFKEAEVSRVKFYFRANKFTPLKRTEFFGVGEFLAHCGGLCGLVMGVTAVNFIELLYYCTVRLFENAKLGEGR